jgi:glycosyltransferase involved in cell wall biosynthesis
LQAAYSWSGNLLSHIAELTRNVDVVHVEHLRGVRYGLYALSLSSDSPTPVVWDSVDCISYLFDQAARARHGKLGRLITRFELPRTRHYEGWLMNQFDRVLVASAVDKEELEALAQAQRRGEQVGLLGGDRRSRALPAENPSITVLANGVDLSYFTPFDEPGESNTVIFTGKMSYHANVSAVVHLITDIMPRIWAKLPDTQLIVVGKDPSEKVRVLANRHSPRVNVTGTVPDIRPYLRRASVAVAPLVYGAGQQLKVLEAMSCAKPVVASPQAVAPLKTEEGRDLLVAHDPGAFADAVSLLLKNQDRRRELGWAGRRYVERCHDWGNIAAKLESVYEEVIRDRRARSSQKVVSIEEHPSHYQPIASPNRREQLTQTQHR